MDTQQILSKHIYNNCVSYYIIDNNSPGTLLFLEHGLDTGHAIVLADSHSLISSSWSNACLELEDFEIWEQQLKPLLKAYGLVSGHSSNS